MDGLKAIWMPYFTPIVHGLNKEIGNFWIELDGQHTITITMEAPADFGSGHFAVMKVHYDGIATIRALDECGFLKRFEETQAQTFYDVFYCLHASGVLVRSHDTDNQLIGSRRMYEMLAQ